MGTLAYVAHDPEREKPIYFKWQLLNWDQIENHITSLNISPLEVPSDLVLHNFLELSDPPTSRLGGELAPTFYARKPNYSERDSNNRKLGFLGEKLVLEGEKSRLINNGRADLAEWVEHSSYIIGDGIGYDILSYDSEGIEKYIEVKTTKGGIGTLFMISSNEVAFSEMNSTKYYLYRVYEYDEVLNNGKFFVLGGSTKSNLDLKPKTFIAKVKGK